MAEVLLVVVLFLLAVLLVVLILYYLSALIGKVGDFVMVFRASGDIKIPVLGFSLRGLSEEVFSSFSSMAVSQDREVDCKRFYFEGVSLKSFTYCSYSGLVYACQVVLSVSENISQTDLYYWFRERFLADAKSRFFAKEYPESKSIEVFGWKGSVYLRGKELVMDFVNESLKKELKYRKIDDMFRSLDERVKRPREEVLRKSYES